MLVRIWRSILIWLAWGVVGALRALVVSTWRLVGVRSVVALLRWLLRIALGPRSVLLRSRTCSWTIDSRSLTRHNWSTSINSLSHVLTLIEAGHWHWLLSIGRYFTSWSRRSRGTTWWSLWPHYRMLRTIGHSLWWR